MSKPRIFENTSQVRGIQMFTGHLLSMLVGKSRVLKCNYKQIKDIK